MSNGPFNFLFNTPSLQVDRRQETRHRVILSGQLFCECGHSDAINCLVMEISDKGARVEVDMRRYIPEFLFLCISNGPARRVRRVWIKGNNIGLQYIDCGEIGCPT